MRGLGHRTFKVLNKVNKVVTNQLIQSPRKHEPTKEITDTERSDSEMTLCRPWKRRIRRYKHEQCMFLSRQNYKIRAYIGTSARALIQYITVVDTGAGSSFVKQEALSPEVLKTLKPLPEQVRVRDANNRRLNILGTVELNVRIGNRQDKVNFYVVERLATDFILGCDFCDKHVEAIRPRKRLIELDDGTTIPIVRGSKKARGRNIPVPSEGSASPNARASSSKIVTTEDVTLPANSQCWVKVKTAQHGLIHVQPVDKLYSNRLCLAGNGIAQVETGKQFGIFIANLERTLRESRLE